MQKKARDHIDDHQDYEGVRYGPITMERYGRFMRMSSDWSKIERERFLQNLKDQRPILKEKINQEIFELLSLIKQVDPLSFLTMVSFDCMINPEIYSEIEYGYRDAYAEYAQGLILGCDEFAFDSCTTENAFKKANAQIKEIFDNVIWYFGSEFAEDDDQARVWEKELRFSLLTTYLSWRGYSYFWHHTDLIRGIFSEHDTFLIEHFGLSTDEIIDSVEYVKRQIQGNHEENYKQGKLSMEVHSLFGEFVREEHIDRVSDADELLDLWDRFIALPHIHEMYLDYLNLMEKTYENPYIIEPSEKVPENLLKLLSADFGDNRDFVSFEKAPGWPTNDSIIYQRPLISYAGQYYCFFYQLLYRNLDKIIGSWIRDTDKSYFEGAFQKKRAKHVEGKALEYISSMLPGAEVYDNLYYRINENGEEKRLETDGVILYDNNLFIIESKAGSLSKSSRRGSITQVIRDAKEIIGSAYSQALRTKQFILDSSQPEFEYENGSCALVLSDVGKYQNIYLINVTLEWLGRLSTHLNSLRTFGLIQGRDWIWSVFINDLRVVSELIESPSEFLSFLQRRIKANDHYQLYTNDELDFLMHYLSEGLFFDDGRLRKLDRFSFLGYTEELDRYYAFIAGKISSAKKPSLNIPEEYKDLVRSIESINRDGFTEITTTLLSLDAIRQKQILDELAIRRSRAIADEKVHDFTIATKELNFGLTFYIHRKHLFDIQHAEYYCRYKKYQLHLDKWLLVIILLADGEESIDFRIYKDKWQYNDQMEQSVANHKREMVEDALKTRKKSVEMSHVPVIAA